MRCGLGIEVLVWRLAMFMVLEAATNATRILGGWAEFRQWPSTTARRRWSPMKNRTAGITVLYQSCPDAVHRIALSLIAVHAVLIPLAIDMLFLEAT